MEKALVVKNLSTKLKKNSETLTPISGISFEVGVGEMVGIVGESGCGKSMTINSIMRLLPDKTTDYLADAIELSGMDIKNMSETEFCNIRGNRMSMVFQEPMTSLNPVLKIKYQLMEPLLLHKGNKKKSKEEKENAKKKAKEILKAVGIADVDRVMNSYPHNLSGGMKQRVVIAMAIICAPEILLADEPTTALDVTIQAQILRLIKDIQKQNNMGVVLVTHDLGVVAEQCDRIIIMYCGQIVEVADTVSIFTNPKHPYTKGLIECIPRLSDECDRLPHIDGNVINIREFERPGCRFASRCQYATEKCKTTIPELIEYEPNHKCRCFRIV